MRLTTRYSADWLPGSLFGTIHEAGHGLYEQGLPADAIGTPAGESVSLGIHESQSRLWENMVGRSKAFWTHYLPKLRALFPQQLNAVDLDAFYAAVNQVEPSLIRVEADEVTYNLHILLRFELECDLIEGRVAVAELPEVWNERMEQYLGIRPSQRRPSACCKTRTGPAACWAISQPTHWAICTQPSFFTKPTRTCPISKHRSRKANSGRSRLGSTKKSPRPRRAGNSQRIGRRGHGCKAKRRLLHLLLVGEVRSALRPQPMTCCKNRSWFAPRILRTSASA